MRTGKHTVRDVFCRVCHTCLGWKYVSDGRFPICARAFQETFVLGKHPAHCLPRRDSARLRLLPVLFDPILSAPVTSAFPTSSRGHSLTLTGLRIRARTEIQGGPIHPRAGDDQRAARRQDARGGEQAEDRRVTDEGASGESVVV